MTSLPSHAQVKAEILETCANFLSKNDPSLDTEWDPISTRLSTDLGEHVGHKEHQLNPEIILKNREAFFRAVLSSLRFTLELTLAQITEAEKVSEVKKRYLENFRQVSDRLLVGDPGIDFYSVLRDILAMEFRVISSLSKTYTKEANEKKPMDHHPDQNVYLRRVSDILAKEQLTDEQIAERWEKYEVTENFQPINVLSRVLQEALAEFEFSEGEISDFCLKYSLSLEGLPFEELKPERLSIFVMMLLDDIHSLKLSLTDPEITLPKQLMVLTFLGDLEDQGRALYLRCQQFKFDKASQYSVKTPEEAQKPQTRERKEVGSTILSWPVSPLSELPITLQSVNHPKTKFKNGISAATIKGDNFDTLMESSKRLEGRPESRLGEMLAEDRRRRVKRRMERNIDASLDAAPPSSSSFIPNLQQPNLELPVGDQGQRLIIPRRALPALPGLNVSSHPITLKPPIIPPAVPTPLNIPSTLTRIILPDSYTK